MQASRQSLPQLTGGMYLTDGGLETTLVFGDRMDLPCFAAFPLIEKEQGKQRLRDYFAPYMATAAKHGAGFLLGSPTWRANPDWGTKLGYDKTALTDINRQSIQLLSALRQDHAPQITRIVLEGVIGPRGDGYRADARMTAKQAETYHREQIAALSDTEADMVGAYTLNYPEEAIGIVRAAKSAGIPVAISFTVETNGKLSSGDTLGSAITLVDEATDSAAAYFMINCAHPSHFMAAFETRETWHGRVRGLRANASRKSHAELDNSTDPDSGDPVDLAATYNSLLALLPSLTVLGGCCGTDHRHIEAIGQACLPSRN